MNKVAPSQSKIGNPYKKLEKNTLQCPGSPFKRGSSSILIFVSFYFSLLLLNQIFKGDHLLSIDFLLVEEETNGGTSAPSGSF